VSGPDLDTYLRRATRGLIGARRRVVRQELHANIVQHALDLQMGGLEASDALARALNDFGPPERVSGGLTRVHTLPAVITALLLASGIGTVAYGLTLHDAGTAKTERTDTPRSEAAPNRTGSP